MTIVHKCRLFFTICFSLYVCFFEGFAANLLTPPKTVSGLKFTAESSLKNEWAEYLSKADRLCDPGSAEYADVESLITDASGQPSKTLGHLLARNLIDWMQTLGMAYRLTDKVKYREHGVTLLRDCARLVPLKSAYMTESFAGGRGDMMRGLATGYDFFADYLDPAQRKMILQTGQDYVDDFLKTAQDTPLWWRPYHNFTGVCGGAAGMMALQLRDADPDAANEDLSQIIALIEEWLEKGFDLQGACFEGVEYSAYPLENVILFADLLKSGGGKNLFSNSTLNNVVNFYMLSVLPGEKVLDARNDSLYENPGELLLKLSSEYNDGVLKWLYEPLPRMDLKRTWAKGKGGWFFLRLLWENDIASVSPEEAGFSPAEYFQGRGLCVWRTGWLRGNVMFSIEAGKYHIVTHNQADKGHFTFYGFGYRWACDPGYANNKNPQGRAQTCAHNCVLIDGKGQALSGAGLGTSGQILAYTNTPVYGYALADCTDAYRRNYEFDNTNPDGRATAHMNLDHAYRHTLFVRETDATPAYAVVLDDIDQDGKNHDYRWQMLSWTNLELSIYEGGAVVSPKDAGRICPKMFVFLSSESPATITQDIYT
ncbi:MAG: heparinase II/III family protein, partial [Kiritimatiellales bacterium]